MTNYSHNNLNQVTGEGGSGGVMQVVLRGQTNEPAVVKAKPCIACEWKDARMLGGNRFEADLNLLSGSNMIYIQASAFIATPQYDADGNLLSDGVRSYEWDRQSRLVKFTGGGSPVKSTKYRYNALGHRSERIEKTGTTTDSHHYSLYDGKDLLCRYTGGTAVANIDRQHPAQGEQRNISDTWTSYYYNRDHPGSIREVLHSDGTLAARYDYDPYGERQTQYLASSYTGGCDLGFTGHITQQSAVEGQGEIVLTLFQAYNLELDRWPSRDPIEEMGGVNLYGFVKNDATNHFDVVGVLLEKFKWIGPAKK